MRRKRPLHASRFRTPSSSSFSPLAGTASVVLVPSIQNIPKPVVPIVSVPIMPAAQASSAAITGAASQQQQLIDSLRRELDEANSYGKHLQEQYRKQMEQLDNANRQLAEAQQQLRSLGNNNSSSNRSPDVFVRGPFVVLHAVGVGRPCEERMGRNGWRDVSRLQQRRHVQIQNGASLRMMQCTVSVR